MTKIEDIFFGLLLAAIAGLMIFSFTIKSAEQKFEVKYFDWQFLYFHCPDFIEACYNDQMDNFVPLIIQKKIEIAQAKVAMRKNIIVTPYLDEEDRDASLDITNEVYDELVRG